MIKQFFVVSAFLFLQIAVLAQGTATNATKEFSAVYSNAYTPVKSQGQTGTCWSFSTTALLESQVIKNKPGSLDLSEMFTVRNIYVEKARNYLMRQGSAQFGEGSLGHDVIRAVATYGVIPEQAYSGLAEGQTVHNHSVLVKELKSYLDSMLATKPLAAWWLTGFENILDKHLGKLPGAFTYDGKIYTPLSFAKELIKFEAGDYVNITSFTHKPYYSSFIIDVPDNFSNGAYYNLPLDEMMQMVKDALKNGYTVMWDADVSNNGFRQQNGLALYLSAEKKYDNINANTTEEKWDAAVRQNLFENLTTQDDHLMQITGTSLSKEGKTFFTVKNSWGNVGPFNGFINVSDAYFAINSISLVVPKAGISKLLLDKLQINK